MATQRKNRSNPFMAAALAPMETQAVKPDLTRPQTAEEAYLVKKHREDMIKGGSKVIKAAFTVESSYQIKEYAASRNQQSENFVAALEEATAPSHREDVENFNAALSTAVGNGVIRTVRTLVNDLNGLVEQDHRVEDAPPTETDIPVTFGDALKGYARIKR